ncbi:MAG: response regulator transcription factor, partial [Pseudomonadales bacterium]|nr:response regulator transcription factor [Pseudomonadales bacterium]
SPVRDGQQRERIVVKDLIVDVGRHEVFKGDRHIELTATEFRILYHLASHPGRAFTREQLLNRVVGENAVVVDRNIDVHIRAIRKKLGDYASMIQTIRGVGYRFVHE